MNQAQLAKACKVSVNTVAAWMSKGCPCTRRKDGHARFDLKAVQRWRKESLIPRTAPAEGYSAARARKETALAELREMQLQQRRGELIEVEPLRRGLDEVIVSQRTVLLGLPSQVGRDLDDPDVRVRVVSVVERNVREALAVLANYTPGIEPIDDDDGDGGEQDESPPPPKGAHGRNYVDKREG